jgi:hypothetical protein
MTNRAMLVGAVGGMAAGMMMAAVEMIYGWASSAHTAWDAPIGNLGLRRRPRHVDAAQPTSSARGNWLRRAAGSTSCTSRASTGPEPHGAPEKTTSHTARGALARPARRQAGTGLMTAYQAVVQSGGSGGDEQSASDEERWQQAPAPARVAGRILEGVFQQQVPADRIPLLAYAIPG